MKHLGDITKIDWSQVEPVDVVTGGSPCQDLSVAGKRAGLAGERSGLYMEQIRCVKELRQADVLRGRTGQFIRPRFMVWENVPGAFSSGKPKGSDFAAVIEELIKIAEPDASVCIVPPGNGWTKSGCYYADDGRWSIAWRVHDAQFWGVPQRRKRIALVADFGGLSAPEVLFERKGLSGDFEQSGTEGQGAAGDAEVGVGTADRERKGSAVGVDSYNLCLTGEVGRTVTTASGGLNEHIPVVIQNEPPVSIPYTHQIGAADCTGNSVIGVDLYNQTLTEGVSKAMTASACDADHVPCALIPYTLKIRSGCAVDASGKAAGKGALIQENKAATIAVAQDQYLFQPVVAEGYDMYNQQSTGEVSRTLKTPVGGDDLPVVCIKEQPVCSSGDVTGTLRAEMGGHPPLVLIYDARGNGGGKICPTITGDHQDRVTDYTAILMEET